MAAHPRGKDTLKTMSRILPLLTASLVAAPMAQAAEGPPWLDPATNTALAALIVFLAIVWYAGGFRFVGNHLDKRRDEIGERLEEARALREEASAALAAAERRRREAKKEAENIVKRAREDAATMKREASDELKRRLARRQELAEARITRAEQDATAEVRRAAADAAVAATRSMLQAQDSGDAFEQAAKAIDKAL